MYIVLAREASRRRDSSPGLTVNSQDTIRGPREQSLCGTGDERNIDIAIVRLKITRMYQKKITIKEELRKWKL